MPVLTGNQGREAAGGREAEPGLGPATEGARRKGGPNRSVRAPEGARPGVFATCANPACNTGWLKLWRSRSGPVIEGGWSCSTACTAALLEAGVRREMEARGRGEESHRHRIPIGLAMLEQGWITGAQLRGALEAQRATGGGRLGQWLVRQQGVGEQLVTRALGLQWSCPVLAMELHDAEGLTSLLPRLFVDAFGALPLRVAAGRILYLGFESRLDPVLALAVERMTGLRVEGGVVQESHFRPAHARMLNAAYPAVELIEAASEPAQVEALSRRLEQGRPVESRLVRMHDCLWLRMWLRPQRGPVPETALVQDTICSVRAH